MTEEVPTGERRYIFLSSICALVLQLEFDVWDGKKHTFVWRIAKPVDVPMETIVGLPDR